MNHSLEVDRWLSEAGGPFVTWLRKRKPRRSKLLLQFDIENMNASKSIQQGDFESAWFHLERAHIISQKSAWRHFLTHFVMFGLALSQRDFREVLGQIIRLLLAIPSSWLNLTSMGNTGRSDVGLFEEMPLPEDLLWLSADSHSGTKLSGK